MADDRSRTCLVAGAAGGLGLAIASRFLDEGWTVHGWDLVPVPDARIASAVVDITDWAALTAAAAMLPALDAVVNSCGRASRTAAAELDPAELAAAKYPEFRAPDWAGPLLVAADMPSDPKERDKLIDAALAGLDLQHFPRYYVPYAERVKEVLGKAVTIARLRAAEPVTAKAVDAYLASSGIKEGDVRALMLRTRFAWVAVLIDPKTAQPVKMLLGEKIE